jgi:hypothetical protein
MNKWIEYEKEKAKLRELPLTHKEYERLIKELIERLEI